MDSRVMSLLDYNATEVKKGANKKYLLMTRVRVEEKIHIQVCKLMQFLKILCLSIKPMSGSFLRMLRCHFLVVKVMITSMKEGLKYHPITPLFV